VLPCCPPDYALASYQAAFKQLPGLSPDITQANALAVAADDAPLDKLPAALATLAHATQLLQPVLGSCSEALSKAVAAAKVAAAAFPPPGWKPYTIPLADEVTPLRLQAAAAAAMQAGLQGEAGWPAGPSCTVALQLVARVAASAALRDPGRQCTAVLTEERRPTHWVSGQQQQQQWQQL
jgi:hypothetical protein